MHGIHSLMREWGCGHRNMEVPRFILRTGGAARDPRLNPSDREVIVDIGLGNDAKETGSAVLNGFVVIAFEPMPENMRSIRRALGKLSTANSKRVDFIDMQRGADGRWTMPPLAQAASRPRPRLRHPSRCGRYRQHTDVAQRKHGWRHRFGDG